MRKDKKKWEWAGVLLVPAAALLPLIIWAVVLFTSENIMYCGFGFFGWAGAALIGVGLGRLCMELPFVGLKAEDGEDSAGRALRFGLICLGAGVPLVTLAAAVMRSPDIESVISYNMGTFHSANQIFLMMPAGAYLYFRFGVTERLRQRRISKSRIKKLSSGLGNKWLYTALQRECGLGPDYGINLAMLPVLSLTAAEVFLLGWVRALLPVTCGLMIAACAIGAVCVVREILADGGKIFRFMTIFRFIMLFSLGVAAWGQIDMAGKIVSGGQI